MKNRETIPFFCAKTVNSGIDFSSSIKRVIDSHWYILGKEVKMFEDEFSEYIGVPECISVANGSDALELALRGAGVESGDEVATVANAGFYSSTAIYNVGAKPLYVDIDETSLTMSTSELEAALELKPKAVIVTHLYGQLANIEKIAELCKLAKVPLIEDCAQAHGAMRNGQMAGSFGDLGCFSFYPTKNLGALGDGGAIVANNPEMAARIRALRQYGWTEKYKVSLPNGRNSRLDELQAAILREKLPRLNSWNKERRLIAQRYNSAFEKLPIICPQIRDKSYVAHLYVIRLNNREDFQSYMTEKGIVTDIHYPIADHKQSAYQSFSNSRLPFTESACRSVISLPCYPGISESVVDQIIGAVKNYFIDKGN